MVRNSICITIAALFALCSLSLISPDISAEIISEESDANNEMAADEAMASVETGGRVRGQVASVNPNSGILMIRNTLRGNAIVAIAVNNDTTYFGTDSIKTIKPGDYISIDCIAIDGAYIADNIVMDNKAPEENAQLPVLEKVLVD
ncbi:MAG: hypothetical protein JW946_02680 [Candidatus Omnitrophica bacterium]|nr:hypothetical protein [Candidatus Omnitrophota bacterium]